VVAQAVAFRAWVVAQGPPGPRRRRSPIDLEHAHFEALRTPGQIHEALHNIAHPEPGQGPAFRPPPPRGRGAGRRRRLTGRSTGRVRAWLSAYGAIVLVLLNSLALVGLAVTGPQGPWPWTVGLSVLAMDLPILVVLVMDRLARGRRGWIQEPRKRSEPGKPRGDRSGGPLHDAWLDAPAFPG